MTSTPFTPDASGTEEHPEVAEISALGEGLLPVDRQADVRAHVAGCGLCADVRTSLDEIRDALGTLPGPARMPEDIAGRIDAALAAEALLDATQPDGEPDEDEEPGSASAPAGEPSVTSRPGAVPVSVPVAVPLTVAVPAGSGDAVSRETDSRGTPPEPPAGSGDAVSRETGPGGRRRWRTLMLAAAAAVAVLGVGGITLQLLSSPDTRNISSDSAENGKLGKGSADAPAKQKQDETALRQRVQTLVADEASTTRAPSTAAPKRGSKGPEFDSEQSPGTGENTLREDEATGTTIPSCIRAAIHRSESPLAVDDSATYENRTGYLVVLPHQGGDPERVDAYVVDPSCVSADRSGPGRVLLKRTYPRG